jgi:hypothetical protein
LSWNGLVEDAISDNRGRSMSRKDIYTQIIEKIFHGKYSPGDKEIIFAREEIISVARKLGVRPPKNLGDVIYSFRGRRELPESIKTTAPADKVWVIRSIGASTYRFSLANFSIIEPNEKLVATKVPEATPGVIVQYALSDEQSLLAKLRYNRLIDIFTGVTCYPLQSHLRTSIADIGQVETDELYIGIDKRGAHYVFPVQAKSEKESLHIVQIENDFAMCIEKFPSLICRPVAAQFLKNDLIALFEFESIESDIYISTEKHYKLVSPEEISPEELEKYKRRKL